MLFALRSLICWPGRRTLALICLCSSVLGGTSGSVVAQRPRADAARQQLEELREDAPIGERLDREAEHAIALLTFDLKAAATAARRLRDHAARAEAPEWEALSLAIEGQAALDADSLDRALDLVREAESKLPVDDRSVARAHMELLSARVLVAGQEWNRAVEHLRQAIELAMSSRQYGLELSAWDLAFGLFAFADLGYEPDSDLRLSLAERPAEVLEFEILHSEVKLEFLASSTGGEREIAERLRGLIPKCSTVGLLDTTKEIYTFLIQLAWDEGRFADAVADAERQLEIAQTWGSVASEALALDHLAWSRFKLGDIDAAADHAANAWDLGRRSGVPGIQLAVLDTLVAIAREREDSSETLRLLDRREKIAERLAGLPPEPRHELANLRDRRLEWLNATRDRIERERSAAVKKSNERKILIIWTTSLGILLVGLLAFGFWRSRSRTKRAYELLTLETERALDAESRRQQLSERVQQVERLESLGLLAAGVAHDFNNILGSIAANVDLLAERSPAGSNEEVHEIRAAVARAASLCERMMDYSQPGRRSTESLALSDLVSSAASLLRAAAKDSAVRFDLTSDTHSRSEVDRYGIEQALVNLISNADEASPSGGLIWVRTRIAEPGDRPTDGIWFGGASAEATYGVIEVEDGGRGMNEERLRRAFDPFYTTRFEGRGLGLSATYGIVKGHAGAIHARSEPEHGSRFSIWLPVGPRESEATEQPTNRSPETEEIPHSSAGEVRPDPDQSSGNDPARPERTRVVLIVDDEPSLCRAITRMFSGKGWEAVGVGDGRSAIEQVRNGLACDLAMIDMSMPGLSGADTVKALLELRPDLRILMMSGHDDSMVRDRLGDQRVDGVLQKPFSNREAVTLAAEIVDRA